jgi:hypothetical protein
MLYPVPTPGPTRVYLPPLLHSKLPVCRSCTPEFVGPQLRPLGLHRFLHNEGLLSVFPFICLTVSTGTCDYAFSFVLYDSINMLLHATSYLLFNLLLSPSVITIRILLQNTVDTLLYFSLIMKVHSEP